MAKLQKKKKILDDLNRAIRTQKQTIFLKKILRNSENKYIFKAKQILLLEQKKVLEKQKQQVLDRRKLDTLSYSGEEYLGPDASLFIDKMQEERYDEIDKLKKSNTIKSETEQNPNIHFEDRFNGFISKIKKTWKDYLVVKEFSKWFSFALSYNTSARNFSRPNSSRESLNFDVSLNPIKYFFLSATFMQDINKYKNKYYQPDFSYSSLGYFDWHPNTWGFSYSNYANNKFNPKNSSKQRFNFDKGTWEVNYKAKINNVNIKGALKYIPSPSDLKFDIMFNKKVFDKISVTSTWSHYFNYAQERVTLSAKSFLYKKFFAEGSVYLYSDLSKQTSNEPDYAYTFGWRDTRIFYPTITYSNYYTPTRWWWRNKKGPSFLDGRLSVYIKVRF